MAEIDTKKIIGELVRQFPLAALLAFALWGNYKAWYVWGSTYQNALTSAQTTLERCETEKAAYAEIAIRGVQFGQERAQQSVDKINQAAPTSKPNVTLSVKPKPVTDREKSAALSPVTNTDPNTLATKQAAVQNLVQKTAPTQDAKVTKN